MRRENFAILFALLWPFSSGADPTPTASASPFTFQSIVAGTYFGKPGKNGIKGCFSGDTCVDVINVAGVQAVATYVFTEGYLTKLTLVSSYPNAYRTLMDAFAEKYGQPCESVAEKWQNAMGVSFDNEITHWCFSTGKL